MTKTFRFLLCATCLCGLTVSSAQAETVAPTSVAAAAFLQSMHAQKEQDWDHASKAIDHLINNGVESIATRKRAMLLYMGAGEHAKAIAQAKTVIDDTPSDLNTLSKLFVLLEYFKAEDYDTVQKSYASLPRDGTINFIGPFIAAWTSAAQGQLDIDALGQNTAQLYHAILISDYLDDEEEIETLIRTVLRVNTDNPEDLEHVADLYAFTGVIDKADAVYTELYETLPESNEVARARIQSKLTDLQQDDKARLFKKITSPQHGLAQAFSDMATLLTQQQNDETARVFAQIALYLKNDLTSAHELIAQISARHAHYDDALSYYNNISLDDIQGDVDEYIIIQHKIADLLMKSGQVEAGLAKLQDTYDRYENILTLINIGDVHRGMKDHKKAIATYNKAQKQLGGKVTDTYWNIHYARGISYEQLGDWEKAEEDLKAALTFRPDHPYVLNYLAYTWADQGVHLEKARDMIIRAVEIEPSDGYITDSLGWVLFRLGDYEQAVNILEQAVNLLPYDPTINDHLGDAYWHVGRRREAVFQWNRAKNFSQDDEQIDTITQKIENGLPQS